MKAINIKWDIDEGEDLGDLPTTVEIPDGIIYEDEISDYLSNVTGYCHKGFELYGKPVVVASFIDDAMGQIRDLYQDSDVCMGELLSGIEIHGLSVEDVITVYARLMYEFDGDTITRSNEEEGWSKVIGQEGPEKPKYVWVLTCETADYRSETNVFGDLNLALKVFLDEVKDCIKEYGMDSLERLVELLAENNGDSYVDIDGYEWDYAAFGSEGHPDSAFFSVQQEGEYSEFHVDIWLEKQEVKQA